jgi:hypothetical protein
MTWERSVSVIDAEIAGLEGQLARVLAVRHEHRDADGRSALGRSTRCASLHEQLARLWAERARVLARFERPA